MVIVRFNQFEEFVAELTARPPEDKTVRLTFSLRYDRQGTAHLTMVAGYLDRGGIVEFVHYLGQQPTDWRSPRAEEIRQLLLDRKAELERLGYTVKSGRYHTAPNLQS